MELKDELSKYTTLYFSYEGAIGTTAIVEALDSVKLTKELRERIVINVGSYNQEASISFTEFNKSVGDVEAGEYSVNMAKTKLKFVKSSFSDLVFNKSYYAKLKKFHNPDKDTRVYMSGRALILLNEDRLSIFMHFVIDG